MSLIVLDAMGPLSSLLGLQHFGRLTSCLLLEESWVTEAAPYLFGKDLEKTGKERIGAVTSL